MLYYVVRMVRCIIDWFDQLLFATETLSIYISAIFISMASGFILKRFGSTLSLGSDKAAQHFKRKGDK